MKKRFLLLVPLALLLCSLRSDMCITKDGYCQGIRLAGNVKIVDHFADFEVQVVNHFPDLKVKKVSGIASNVGEWRFVDKFPDFTVKIVDHFPDFTIQYVSAFPGVNHDCPEATTR